MSKRGYKKSGKDYQARFIKKENSPHENYARIYRSLFYNERFKKLSPTSKLIYCAIILECKNGDRTKCTFPKSAYEKITSKQTFHKSIEELEKNGFIEVHHFRTKANIYKLSDNWKYDSFSKKENKYIDINDYKRFLEG